MRFVHILERRLAALRHDRSGIAVPIVLIVMTIGFALASVGSLAAIGSIRNAGRDNSDKGAFGVAEAAAQAALFRQNKILTTPTVSAARCLATGVQNTLIATFADADGWCREQTGTVNGGTYSYRVKPDVMLANGQRQVEVVAEGVMNGETRRVQVSAAASTGTPVFGGGQVVGLNKLDFQGGSGMVVNAAMRTNGDLSVGNNTACNGAVTVGVGKRVYPSNLSCGGSVSQGTTTLGPVDMGNVRTDNVNLRLSDGRDVKTDSDKVDWNPTTKSLDLGSQSTITLGGTNYLLCSLSLDGGSQLIVAQGAKVRIYFDTPENCGLASPAKQISFGGNSRVTVTSANPADLAFLVAGSDTRTTTVEMGGNSRTVNDVTVYAPKSIVSLSGNNTFRGAIAGKELSAQGSVNIIGVSSTLSFTAAVELAYTRTRFVECVGSIPATGSPSTGC